MFTLLPKESTSGASTEQVIPNRSHKKIGWNLAMFSKAVIPNRDIILCFTNVIVTRTILLFHFKMDYPFCKNLAITFTNLLKDSIC